MTIYLPAADKSKVHIFNHDKGLTFCGRTIEFISSGNIACDRLECSMSIRTSEIKLAQQCKVCFGRYKKLSKRGSI